MKNLFASLSIAVASFDASATAPTYDVVRLVPPHTVHVDGWSVNGLNASGVIVGGNFNYAFRGTVALGFRQIRADPALSQYASVDGVDDAGNAAGSDYFNFPTRTATLFPRFGPAQDLGALIPEADFSVASSMSRGGQVAGHYEATVNRRRVDAAFVWSASGGIQRIGDTLQGDYTYAYGVNDAGHVVGLHDSRQSAAFFWSQDGGLVDIPGSIIAYAVNDRDEVVGQALASNRADAAVAFLQASGSAMVRMPRPADTTGSCYAADINALSQVVGGCVSQIAGTINHAVLWWPDAGTYSVEDLTAQLGVDEPRLRGKCSSLDDNGLGEIDYRAVATNAVGQVLVQIDCNFVAEGGASRLGFESLLLTPQAIDRR